ncbi:ion transporter [Halocynthiibacter styelae]|uniref:ion transporter n=1 Tax=Halocynthiibacter styelae TaxID=2761955 RepID=UPI001E58C638|nr:ion transporter [Paenihalocynthiibacter styelae]
MALTRQDIILILDGGHPTVGYTVSTGLNVLIGLSAVAIALETVPGLPDWAGSLLWKFEVFILSVFILEYALKVICSPKPLKYIFSFWGIIDLLSCAPALALLNPHWQAVRTLRLMRILRMLKPFHSSRILFRLRDALHLVKGELYVFGILSGVMLYISSVGIYLFEHDAQPDVFTSIPESFWWAIASFTTVGYGDMVPITTGGRFFTAIVLFIGLGIVAVPSAIITTALLETQTNLRPLRDEEKNKTEPDDQHGRDQ